MDNLLFLSEKDKKDVTVGFSKKEIKNHKGISGLKFYPIVLFLRKHLEVFGEVSFTLNRLLNECGYSTRSHNQSVYSDFREIIKTEIINKGFATCNADIFTVSPSDIFTVSFSEKKNLFFSEDNFVQMSISEFETITQKYFGTVNKSVLFGVYIFIKQYILADSGLTDMLPRISWPSKQQIRKGIGISSVTTIERAVSALNELGMIYIKSDMFVEHSKEKNIYVPTRNVYALDQEDLNNDAVLPELKKIYGKQIYNRDDVPGQIQYLPKEKE